MIIHTNYNLGLVLLSVLVATLASFVALDLIARMKESKGTSRLIWLVVGSLVMGLGIWSMHFVGMLFSTTKQWRAHPRFL